MITYIQWRHPWNVPILGVIYSRVQSAVLIALLTLVFHRDAWWTRTKPFNSHSWWNGSRSFTFWQWFCRMFVGSVHTARTWMWERILFIRNICVYVRLRKGNIFTRRLSFCPQGRGACVAKGVGVHGEWGMHGKGGACVVRGERAHVVGGMRGRRDGHSSGRYASYWNAFLWQHVHTQCLRFREWDCKSQKNANVDVTCKSTLTLNEREKFLWSLSPFIMHSTLKFLRSDIAFALTSFQCKCTLKAKFYHVLKAACQVT